MTFLIYLATPIDFSHDSKERVKEIRHQITDAGHGVYVPQHAWSVPSGAVPNASLQRANVDVLLHCHGFLAVLEPRVFTIGTIAELVIARSKHIPAVCVGDLSSSWALPYLEVPAYVTVSQALEHLTQAMQIDSDQRSRGQDD